MGRGPQLPCRRMMTYLLMSRHRSVTCVMAVVTLCVLLYYWYFRLTYSVSQVKGQAAATAQQTAIVQPERLLLQPQHASVGCTYWKRIIHFLNNDTEGHVRSPFDIDRFFVHFGSKHRTKVASYNVFKANITDWNRVMFTRDPWTRVWSSYVDKFVLPDSWLDHGEAILQRRRAAGFSGKACASNVHFVEFLVYAMYVSRDQHWKPVHQVCSPCLFRPQYVGKMETFSRDSGHILQKLNLSRVLEGHETHASYAENEVRMLADYHFRLFETRAGLRVCLKHSGVAHRLWKAFVLNGYIGEKMEFPRDEFRKELDSTKNSTQAAEKAVKLLLKYHKSSPLMTSQEMNDYRRRVMVEHYRKAPKTLLHKMATVFRGDFAMFGYEAHPGDIFGPS